MRLINNYQEIALSVFISILTLELAASSQSWSRDRPSVIELLQETTLVRYRITPPATTQISPLDNDGTDRKADPDATENFSTSPSVSNDSLVTTEDRNTTTYSPLITTEIIEDSDGGNDGYFSTLQNHLLTTERSEDSDGGNDGYFTTLQNHLLTTERYENSDNGTEGNFTTLQNRLLTTERNEDSDNENEGNFTTIRSPLLTTGRNESSEEFDFVSDGEEVELINCSYVGLVIEIEDGVPEDATLIDRIKVLMTDASKQLGFATGRLFGEVTISVPHHWTSVQLSDKALIAKELRIRAQVMVLPTFKSNSATY